MTRRNVLRVNKTWYDLAAPLLYEYILLGSGSAVHALSVGMERSSAQVSDDDSARPIGWWTRRLDVNMRDRPSGNPQLVMNALARILSCLPNLRILTFSITGHRYRPTLPSNVLQALVCHQTLRVVHWYTDHFPSISSLSAFIRDYPRLQSANANEIMNSQMPHIHLDSLEIVHVHGTGFLDGEASTMTSHIWALELPSVRHAIYDIDFSGNDDLLVHNFFSAVGRQLLTILLYYLPSDNDMEPEFNLQTTFEQLYEHCNALEQVNLLLHSWSMLGLQSHSLPAKVCKIVVRIIKGQLSRSAAYELFTITLRDLKTLNPHLKAIQFYSSSNIQNLRRHPFALSAGLSLLGRLGLSILDDEGNILKP